MYVINKPTQKQINALLKMEKSCADTISGQETLLQGMEEFHRASVGPLGVVNVEPMDEQQDSVEEQAYVQFDRNEVIDDMGISETVEVELPYLYPAGESQDSCEKLSANVQYGDTQQDAVLPEEVSAIPLDDHMCRSNVVVEKIMYEMPLIKADVAGDSADFEGKRLVQGYQSAAVVYPQDVNAAQWSVHVDDTAGDNMLHHAGGEHPAKMTSSTGRLITEKHRTITIKDVTNRGKKKSVSPPQNQHKVASSCPVTASALSDTIIIVSPKSQTMTPLQVQHPTLTQLLGPFMSTMPAPSVGAFKQARENTPRSPPHTHDDDAIVDNVATLSQLEAGLAISGSHPAVGDLVIIESQEVVENLHAEDSVTVTPPQKEVPSAEREEVVCSPSQGNTTSVTATPKIAGGQQTIVSVSATRVTVVPKTSELEVHVTSSSTTLNPETNKALKMLLSKVSHEQQREINVVGLVADSCNGIGKPPETLADRYMKNWKQTGQFQCKFCPYSSVTRNYLYRHWMANHSSVTPYQCHHCDLKASSRDVITRHQAVAHRSSAKSVLIDSMLEQHTIDQFDQIFNASFGRDGQAAENATVGANDAVDAKKVKMENNECSDRHVIGVAQSDGFCGIPVVEVRILAGNVYRQRSVICNALGSVTSQSSLGSDTQNVKSECHSSPAVTIQHEPVSLSHPSNTEHPQFDTEHTNVVSEELSDISTNVIEVTHDTHVHLSLGDTDSDKITDVIPDRSSLTQGPKPEQLQEQMMAALHSCSDV